MRMRKKKNLLPRMEACGALLIEDPRALRGRWRELLPGAKELRVELGCGKGRFTAETAAAEPDVLLIAVEKVPDAMVVAMERACTTCSLWTATPPACRTSSPPARWTASISTSAIPGPKATRKSAA